MPTDTLTPERIAELHGFSIAVGKAASFLRFQSAYGGHSQIVIAEYTEVAKRLAELESRLPSLFAAAEENAALRAEVERLTDARDRDRSHWVETNKANKEWHEQRIVALQAELGLAFARAANNAACHAAKAEARREEREACAKLAESKLLAATHGGRATANEIAAAIRARGTGPDHYGETT